MSRDGPIPYKAFMSRDGRRTKRQRLTPRVMDVRRTRVTETGGTNMELRDRVEQERSKVQREQERSKGQRMRALSLRVRSIIK